MSRRPGHLVVGETDKMGLGLQHDTMGVLDQGSDLVHHLEHIGVGVAMHHMVDRSHGDAYFSTVFSIWDVIWKTTGTYLARDEMRDVELGLPDGRESGHSVLEWIMEPVRKRNLALSRSQPSESD